MGPELINIWEERLRFADRVWEHKGLKGGEGYPQYAREGMDAYRNYTSPEDGWGDLEADAIQRIPITFSSMNTMEAQLLARDPQMSLYPRTKEAAESAPIVETLINYYIYELRMRRQWKRALKDANIVSGFGIVWHGYTPAIRKIKTNKVGEPERLIETYDPARPDTPWIRRVAPWDVRIDPTCSSFHPDEDAEWCARRCLISPQQFDDDPMFARIDVQPTYSWEHRFTRRQVDLAGDEGPDLPEQIEIWEFYDKVNQIMFHLSPGASGKVVTKGGERAWPEGIPREGLPYSYLAFNEQSDDPFPLSYESMIHDQNIELNKLRTMMAELTKRLRRVVLYRKDFLGEGEAEHMIEDLGLKEWVEAQGGDLDNIIKEINLGTFPQELMLYEQVIKETIRETLGQSNFQRARRENVESAEEASRIGMGDDTQVGRNQSAMEEFITDSVRKWHQGLRAVATDDILVPLLDEQDARELVKNTNNPYLRATPKQIQGEFLFRMRLGSSRPTNEQREKQEAMVMLEMMQRFPERMVADQFIVDWLMAFNKSPSRYMLNAEEIQATGANVPPGEPGMAGGGNGAGPVTADPNILSTFIGTNR
jgi:hypothetical protein